MTKTTSSEDSAFHIAFCVDNHYFRSMGATIASVIAHNPGRRFVFHVFAFSFTDDQTSRLHTFETNPLIEVRSHVIDEALFSDFAEMIRSSYYSLSTFSRLMITSMLKDVTDKVLYLDADMLCVGSIDELASIDMRDTIALVVSDVGWDHGKGRDGRYSILKLNNPQYFNAGVIYINVRKWEEARISEQAIRTLVDEGKKLAFNDQDALNIVLDGRAQYIGKKWNYIYSMIADLKRGQLKMMPVGDAVFIHFAGAIKPWNDWSGHEARAMFMRYHALSPWSDFPLDPSPLNYKEMRIHSRALFKHGRIIDGLRWYVKANTRSFLKKALR